MADQVWWHFFLLASVLSKNWTRKAWRCCGLQSKRPFWERLSSKRLWTWVKRLRPKAVDETKTNRKGTKQKNHLGILQEDIAHFSFCKVAFFGLLRSWWYRHSLGTSIWFLQIPTYFQVSKTPSLTPVSALRPWHLVQNSLSWEVALSWCHKRCTVAKNVLLPFVFIFLFCFSFITIRIKIVN